MHIRSTYNAYFIIVSLCLTILFILFAWNRYLLKTTTNNPEGDTIHNLSKPDSITSIEVENNLQALNSSIYWSTSTLNRENCSLKYGNRTFIPLSNSTLQNPALLYSFPGSGNTWTRLLLEYATGYYTGSAYSDDSLAASLPGEYHCDSKVVVVKYHPFTPIKDILRMNKNQNYQDTTLLLGTSYKCLKVKFTRAIILIRDPFDSIWAEFLRQQDGSHNKAIPVEYFNMDRWNSAVDTLVYNYNMMSTVEYPNVEKFLTKDNITYIRYEDLKNSSTRVEALHNITQFLHLDVPKERIECAFTLSSDERIHRSVDVSREITKETLYTKERVCALWKKIGKLALGQGYRDVKYGYDCQEVDRCLAIVDNIHYHNISSIEYKNQTPPILYSFPGAGNSYVRRLIEYGTGIYTGTPHYDSLLRITFQGEGRCDKTVSAIKLIPTLNPFNRFNHMIRCPGLTFSRALMVIRDPYDAIFYEAIRKMTGSVITEVDKSNFNSNVWMTTAMGVIQEYFQMWNESYRAVTQHYQAKDVLFIKYEDILQPSTQVDTLSTMVTFLNGKAMPRSNIECAYALTINDNIPKASDMKKEDVFRSKEVICTLWMVFGRFVSKFGYKPMGGYHCDEDIPEVLYNHKNHMSKLKLVF